MDGGAWWATVHGIPKSWTWLRDFTFIFTSTAQHKQRIKKQRHHFANKRPYSQSSCFSSGHVWTWELDQKESWVLKNWCFWAAVLKKTLENPLDCKIKPVNLKGNQPWIIIGRTNVEAEASILWPPDAKSWLNAKDPDAGKTKGRRRKGQQRMRHPLVSLAQWTWVWANSGRQWRTEKPGML